MTNMAFKKYNMKKIQFIVELNVWQYKIVLDYEARNCQIATMIEREQIFNNRTKPSMFYIACCA